MTRFEWSLRPYQARLGGRQYLAEYTFEWFLGLLMYATEFWGELRLPEGGDEHHKDRWPLHPRWVAVRAGSSPPTASLRAAGAA